MNFRMVIFSGIMTALVGAMIGLAIAHIAERVERKKIILITGATLGFAIGASSQCVIQRKNEIYEEGEDYQE